jgi:hypothetical protein
MGAKSAPRPRSREGRDLHTRQDGNRDLKVVLKKKRTRRSHKRRSTNLYLYLVVRCIHLPRHRARVARLDGFAEPSEA